MPLSVTTSYIENTTSLFHYYKQLAEGAIAQMTDEQLVAVLDPRMNSAGVLMKHMAGNMLSRWTDFLSTDGEKPFRNRKGEFENPPSRQDLMRMWEEAWVCAFAALETLTDADLSKTIAIRGEAHSVLQAISRQITHCAYHVGQIVLLAKHFAGEGWKPLKVARG
jgi:hypothetical protein